MSDYRRAYQPRGCYFFTVVAHERREILTEPQILDRMRNGFRRVMDRHPFQVDAIVILPDHLHCIWRLPEGDADFSLRRRLTKRTVATGLDAPTSRRGKKPGLATPILGAPYPRRT